MIWEFKTLDELGLVARGKSKHRPRNDKKLFGGAYPFIQTADVKKANFYISEYSETYNEVGLAQSKLWNPGTLCITIAANIADTGILSMPACFPDSIMGFVPYDDISDVRFIKYCFDILQSKCKQISQGTAQDNLSWEKLSTIKFPAPSLNIQRRIAEILSRYDSLIENYQKQIKLLEEAAQRIYKEWFVDLRFPGYENTKIVDGVPERWERKKAQDFFAVSIGKTPPRVEKKWFTDGENGIPWVSIADMKDVIFIYETSEKLIDEACNKFNVKILPLGTVILSFKLTVGRVAITSVPVCTNEAIAHFSKKGSNWIYYTYSYLKNYNFDTLGNTSGISKAVNSTIIKNMPFMMPCEEVLSAYEKVLQPYFNKMNNLYCSIRFLTEARDRLLPKLMNGEIEV